MVARIIIEDLFNTDCEVICHQVNCLGRMGSGIAKEIRKRFPKAYDSYMETYSILGSDTLGGCSLIKLDEPIGTVSHIANLYGQYSYIGAMDEGDLLKLSVWNSPDFSGLFNATKLRFTNYEAVYRGLEKLRYDMIYFKLKSVAFPYKFGSDRGGADWAVMLAIINSVFASTEIDVKIYKLPFSEA